MMAKKFVMLLMIMTSLLLAAGCGGSSADDTDKQADGETTMEEGGHSSDDSMEGDDEAMEGDDEAMEADDAAAAGDVGAGKDLFTQLCGGCHTLDDAGTTGAVGPELSGGGYAAADVADIIENGAGAMPAGLASGDDADDIAAYVEDATK